MPTATAIDTSRISTQPLFVRSQRHRESRSCLLAQKTASTYLSAVWTTILATCGENNLGFGIASRSDDSNLAVDKAKRHPRFIVPNDSRRVATPEITDPRSHIPDRKTFPVQSKIECCSPERALAPRLFSNRKHRRRYETRLENGM